MTKTIRGVKSISKDSPYSLEESVNKYLHQLPVGCRVVNISFVASLKTHEYEYEGPSPCYVAFIELVKILEGGD